MNLCSLNDLPALIKQLINNHEALTQNLIKINSLLQIASNEAFLNNSKTKLHDFICVLSDLSEATLNQSEASLKTLITEGEKLNKNI